MSDWRTNGKHRMLKTTCHQCGIEFEKAASNFNKVKRHFCSRQCFGKSIENSIENFWLNVNKIPGGCWEWTAALNSSGYGSWSVKRRQVKAHRISYEMAKGAIPDGLHVLHDCDNRKCVNPGHLFLGTNAENIEDRVAKDRSYRKIGSKDVQEIIAKCKAGALQREVAAEYGVTQSHVSKLCKSART